nr:glycoside hydrolase family 88 protein [Paenibacillus pinihumi]
MIVQLKGKTPHATKNGVYDNIRNDWWTSGFWPGMLWICYDISGKPVYRDEAAEWDIRLEQCFIGESRLHHDVGFQFLLTAVLKYKITGDEDARRRGLQAANFLAGRFNIAGNFIRAQNDDKIGRAIIDSAMNLSILFWASQETGDPRFSHIARAHAETILTRFIREDGSVRHIVRFDPFTGEFAEALGGQGYGPDSSWTRGQAWAIYGLANIYRFTGERIYLDACRKVADYFITALSEDSVTVWDFRVPEPEMEPKDTSASSIAASGLLELAMHLPEAEGRVYKSAALKMLTALTNDYAVWDDPEYEGILRGGTGHKPEMKDVDVSLIYGDYFYVEAIAKLKGWNRQIF